MKKLFLSSVSALALAVGPAQAAPPAPPAPVWTGFYLGIQGGAVWHKGTFKDIDGAFGAFGNSYDATKTGGLLGGYAGYNWQMQNLVFGLEGDVNWVGAKASVQGIGVGASPNSGAPQPYNQSADVPWLATLRGRLGYAVDSNLFYFTGGLAIAGVKNSMVYSPNPVNFYTESKTKTGWTIGGGIEHKFNQNWSARLEYRYVDLGHDTVPHSVLAYRGEFSNKLSTVLIGLGYKF